MKYFVLSLHRSGTRSVSVLLEQLGISTKHWPGRFKGEDLQQKIEGRETDYEHVLDMIAPVFTKHNAVSDVPIPVLYRQLYRRYKDAKFIILRRDPLEWVRSIRKSIGDRDFSLFERVQYWHYFPTRPANHKELSDDQLVDMYNRHTAEVVKFFQNNEPTKLGVFDIHDPQSGSAIAAFLGFKGERALPYVSDPSRWKRWIAKFWSVLKRVTGKATIFYG